jgi:hypothetical protein
MNTGIVSFSHAMLHCTKIASMLHSNKEGLTGWNSFPLMNKVWNSFPFDDSRGRFLLLDSDASPCEIA